MSRPSILEVIKFAEKLKFLCEKYNVSGCGFKQYTFAPPTDLEEVKLLPKDSIRNGRLYVEFSSGTWYISINRIGVLQSDPEAYFLDAMLKCTFEDTPVLW